MKPKKTRVPRSRTTHPRQPREAAPTEVNAPAETVAEVRQNRALSANRFLLDLRVSMPAARPGQFIMLGLPQGAAPVLRRPFSVLGHDPSRKSLEILYSVEGSGTRILSEVTRGQKLSLLGPLGNNFPQAAVTVAPRAAGPGVPAPLNVLVAGGRGIAPLVFLAESMTSRKEIASGPVLFLAGARTAAELALLDRIRATEVFVSTDDGSLGKKGTVIELLKGLDRQVVSARRAAAPVSGKSPGAVLYGCGPAGMLRALHSYSASKGLPCLVSLEAGMACGLGVCQGCAVGVKGSRYALVCKDGPVFQSDLVDWARYESP